MQKYLVIELWGIFFFIYRKFGKIVYIPYLSINCISGQRVCEVPINCCSHCCCQCIAWQVVCWWVSSVFLRDYYEGCNLSENAKLSYLLLSTGKMITAAYVPLPTYHNLFPDSMTATQLLVPSRRWRKI